MTGLEAKWADTCDAAQQVVEVSPETKHLVPVFHHCLSQLCGFLQHPRRHAATLDTLLVIGAIRRDGGTTQGLALGQHTHHNLHPFQDVSLLGQREAGDNGRPTREGERPVEGSDPEHLHVIPDEGHPSPPALPVNLVQQVGTI